MKTSRATEISLNSGTSRVDSKRARELKLGLIPNWIRYTFDFSPTRFNSVWFLTLILISSTFDSFSIRNSIEEGKSRSFMTCHNSSMSILLGMATSDWKNNARFGIRIPKNPYEQLD